MTLNINLKDGTLITDHQETVCDEAHENNGCCLNAHLSACTLRQIWIGKLMALIPNKSKQPIFATLPPVAAHSLFSIGDRLPGLIRKLRSYCITGYMLRTSRKVIWAGVYCAAGLSHSAVLIITHGTSRKYSPPLSIQREQETVTRYKATIHELYDHSSIAAIPTLRPCKIGFAQCAASNEASSHLLVCAMRYRESYLRSLPPLRRRWQSS